MQLGDAGGGSGGVRAGSQDGSGGTAAEGGVADQLQPTATRQRHRCPQYVLIHTLMQAIPPPPSLPMYDALRGVLTRCADIAVSPQLVPGPPFTSTTETAY